MSCWRCGAGLRSNDFMCRACGSSAKRPSHVARQDTAHSDMSVARFEYAGIIARWVALVLDRVLLGLVAWLVAVQFHLLPDAEAMETALIEGQSVFDLTWVKGWMGPAAAAQLAISVLYYGVGLSVWGRTAGALVMGLRVVDSATGERPFVLSAIIRPLVADLSLTLFVAGMYGDVSALVYASFGTGFITNLGYAMARWTAKSQTLHDKLAGTVVVNAGWRRDRPRDAQWDTHNYQRQAERTGSGGRAF